MNAISLSTKSLLLRYARVRELESRPGRALRFCVRAWVRPEMHRQWFAMLDRPELRGAVAYSPRMCERVQRDYISTQFSPAQRSLLLRKHFELVCALPAAVREAVYSPAGYEIARFVVADIEHVLKLQHVPLNAREGDLGLVWECSLGRVATAAFALANSRRGVRVLLVGGLQGGRGDAMVAMYRTLTRSMYGLRPMSALVQFLQLMAQALAADEVLGVTSTAHIRFKPGKTLLDYDQLWQEHGGSPHVLGLLRVPAAPAKRDLAEVASSKRSMYRKRYALLDEVAVAMGAALAWSSALPPPRVEQSAARVSDDVGMLDTVHAGSGLI